MKKFFTVILTAIIFFTAIQIVLAASYVGNKNSKIFHYSTCSYAVKMKDGNKIIFNSRDEAIQNGYRPCKKCSP